MRLDAEFFHSNSAILSLENFRFYAFTSLISGERSLPCFMSYWNTKDTDQPIHACSLISIYVICCLESVTQNICVRNFKHLARSQYPSVQVKV